ncbi:MULTISPECIES: L,D-transpeptidase [Rhodomicrobium]|uniref:L,D-transpeptidase n=1 Tax=Rhodomicrobium TaxID=1068 RepID=UPI000B4C2023|nr:MULTISPECIES: L,D-transpeptidase [Rhodomicrobium]
MRILTLVFAACLLSLGFAKPADASLLVRVDKGEQRMRVYVDDRLMYTWPVSTGRSGYSTPPGLYRPYTLSRYHRSRRYNNAPMPYSIFYRGGYAIHGTNDINRLGGPASHGCIRLHTTNARELFQMVEYFGKDSTRIVIHQ